MSSTSRAKPSAVGASYSRFAKGAASRTACIITARKADGVPPAISA